jgi:hypothetical protein
VPVFASFQATGTADCVTYQDVRHEFPAPGEDRECRSIEGISDRNSLGRTWVQNPCVDSGLRSLPSGRPEAGLGGRQAAPRNDGLKLLFLRLSKVIFVDYRPIPIVVKDYSDQIEWIAGGAVRRTFRASVGMRQPNRQGRVMGHSACQCSERQRRVPTLAQGNALGLHRKPNISPERVVNKTIIEKFVSYYQYITISSQALCPVRVQNVFQARITTF